MQQAAQYLYKVAVKCAWTIITPVCSRLMCPVGWYVTEHQLWQSCQKMIQQNSSFHKQRTPTVCTNMSMIRYTCTIWLQYVVTWLG